MKINTARRAENFFGYRAEFERNKGVRAKFCAELRAENFFGHQAEFEQNKGVRAEFEQNKRFSQALQAGRISHFTSRIYPSLLHLLAKQKKKWTCIN